MTITVVGLGPGNGRFLTREAWQTLSTAETVYLRTKRHPTVQDLPDDVVIFSFDDLYETADTFADVYNKIVATLITDGKKKEIVYAVPGHPFVGEFTVTQLVTAAKKVNLQIKIIPGLSFIEAVLTALKIDGLDGLQLFDALEITQFHYPPINSDVPTLLGQVYNQLIASELKLILTSVYPDEHSVFLVHAAGTEEEVVEAIPLYKIDRSPKLDHLTSLYVPPLPYNADLTTLAETVAVLRSPEGCPWDQKQTPQSMRSGLLEEMSEVLVALDNEDFDNLQEELGDVLFHLVMQAQMGAEMGFFKLTDVIAGIDSKLKRRHPHVWGDWQVDNSDDVVLNWEMLKQKEKGKEKPASLLDNIPHTLPALAQSQKIQSRVHKVGFDWANIKGVYDKLEEEIIELKTAVSVSEQQMELGDLLFVVVNLARWLDVDAETALREANLRFSQRFRKVEQLARERNLEISQMDLDSLDVLWQEAKRRLAKMETTA